METQGISVEKLLDIIEEKDRKIAELEQQLQWLMSQIRLAKHKQFGVSSERIGDAQLSIFNEAELCSDMTIPEPDFTEVKAHYRKRTRLTTDKLPPDLPVEIIEHELPAKDCICPECGRSQGRRHSQRVICGYTVPVEKQNTIWCFMIINQIENIYIRKRF